MLHSSSYGRVYVAVSYFQLFLDCGRACRPTHQAVLAMVHFLNEHSKNVADNILLDEEALDPTCDTFSPDVLISLQQFLNRHMRLCGNHSQVNDRSVHAYVYSGF